MVEPPCTTFSIMRRPPLRSREVPFGFDVRDEQTLDGNILAHRGLQLLWMCGLFFIAALLETPNSSKLKFLPSWKAIEKKDYAEAVRVDSCQYGSPHLKSFKLLTVHLKISHAARRCQGGHVHIPVEGAYTKASATYTDELSEAIARDFFEVFPKIREGGREDLDVKGLEGFLPNEVMMSSLWEVKYDWAFPKENHINILEMKVVHRLIKGLVMEKMKARVVSFIDSNVCRCCLGKGRSTSRALTSVLRRINTLLIAGGLWLVTPFMPTRLNSADDPTRLVELRPPLPSLGVHQLSRELIFKCACLPRTRRWASGWVRITIRLIGFSCIEFGDKSKFRRRGPIMDFDSTLGYPGEGPVLMPISDGFRQWASCFISSLHWFSSSSFPYPPIWTFVRCFDHNPVWTSVPPRSLQAGLSRLPSRPSFHFGRCLFLVLLFSNAAPGVAMDGLRPRNAADFLRSEQRVRFGPLPAGRVVLPRTTQLRTGYLDVFREWCGSQGIDLEFLLENFRECIDELNLVLCRFGRRLYEVGRPRNHYIETINGLTSIKPGLRRMVQQAWDLGFSWTKMEPSNHHVAAPFQVLMGMISLCILWGWSSMAGALGLMWGALLRPGEFLTARISDLLLPRDVGNTIAFAILSIQEPKTRNVAARHQAARLDIPDLLTLVQAEFFRLQGHQKLWPSSGQTLRTRFKSVLAGLGLPSSHTQQHKALDLGSMRAGGATWLLEMTENGNLVQRRGRWISEKVMSLYIQELSANIYLSQLSEKTRMKILKLAHAFPSLVQKAVDLHDAKIPETSWYRIFSFYPGKE